MKKSLKILVPLVILIFLGWTIGQNWMVIQGQITSANLLLIFFAILLLMITHLGGAYFWWRILQAISLKIPFKEAFRIFIVSNFGRFIPGIVLHYVARVYLSKSVGVDIKRGTSSVFLEAYYTLGGAVIVSIFALPILAGFFHPFWPVVVVWAAVLVMILLLSPVQIFNLCAKIPLGGKFIPILIYQKGWREHLTLLSISAFLFILYGGAFYLLSTSFTNNPPSLFFPLSGLLSLSWIIGFLTPVAPGGLGVSDLSFAFLLTSFYSFSFSSFLSLIFRFSLLLAEGIMFIIVIKLSGWNLISSKEENGKL